MNAHSVVRKILRQPADSEGVDELVADVLGAPASAEDALVSAVRKSGGDDSVEVVAVAARRTLAALAKAYRDAGRPVPTDVAAALAGDNADDDDDENDGLPASVEEDAKRKPKKGGAEEDTREPRSPFDAMSKEDAQSLLEAIKDVLPDWRADAIQKEHPGLTRAQAVAEAYRDPWLYSLAQRREAERMEKADTEYRDRAARADRELRSLVTEIRKADPSLTEAKAWKTALDQRPDLYVPAPAPTYDPADAIIAKAERDTADKKYQRLADELRTRDSRLTAAQAYARAMQLHPEWYSR